MTPIYLFFSVYHENHTWLCHQDRGGFDTASSFFFTCMHDRAKGRVRGAEDKKRGSTLAHPQSEPSVAMESKGVCVLMLVLMLVNCSLQQTPPKKKPVRKGTLRRFDDSAVVVIRPLVWEYLVSSKLFHHRTHMIMYDFTFFFVFLLGGAVGIRQ